MAVWLRACLARDEPGVGGDAALRPVAGNDEAGAPQLGAAIMPEQFQFGGLAKMPPRGQITFTENLNLAVPRGRGERGVQRGIADDIAHRRVGGVPCQFERRTPPGGKAARWRALGNGKPADRRRRGVNPVPDTECFQHAGTGGIDRCRAVVPSRDGAAATLDKHDPVAGMRQRGRRHQACQPATDDCDVMHQCRLRR